MTNYGKRKAIDIRARADFFEEYARPEHLISLRDFCCGSYAWDVTNNEDWGPGEDTLSPLYELLYG